MFSLCGTIFKPKVPKFKPPTESNPVNSEVEIKDELSKAEEKEE